MDVLWIGFIANPNRVDATHGLGSAMLQRRATAWPNGGLQAGTVEVYHVHFDRPTGQPT
jgi:hypothetical protein